MKVDRNRPLAGAHHDLDLAHRSLNEVYFDGLLESRVYWGIHEAGDGTSFTQAEAYTDTGVVIVSPVLDVSWLPKYYFNFVVFHEMLHVLHKDVGKAVLAGDVYHTVEFFRSEARFAHVERARAWLEKNNDRLLRRSKKVRL